MACRVFIASLFLAALCYRFVEQPFRKQANKISNSVYTHPLHPEYLNGVSDARQLSSEKPVWLKYHGRKTKKNSGAHLLAITVVGFNNAGADYQ